LLPDRAVRRHVIHLDPHTTRRVTRLFRRYGLTARTCSLDELLEHAASPERVALIADPGLMEPRQSDALLATLNATPKAMVAYASLSPAGVEGALEFARHSLALVAFQNLEEDYSALARTLIAVADPTYTTAVLNGLMPRLRMLPPSLASAAVTLFAHESAPGTPAALAKRSQLARRTVDRWLDRVGIASTRLLVIAPTMLRSLTLLHQTNLSLRRVAHLAGYSVIRRLYDYAEEFTGMTPNELRAMDNPMDAIARLLDRLVLPLGDGAVGDGHLTAD
jgi:hypothetical protein